MQSIILVLFSVFCINASALECYAFVVNDREKEAPKKKLSQASYDKDFLEADIGQYSFGVDKFTLQENGALTLIVIGKKTNSSVASTAGWKTIKVNDGTTTLTNDLRLFFKKPDGSEDEAQINCYDYL